MIHKKTQIFEHTMILLVVASSLMGCSTNQNKIFEQQEYEAKRSNIVFKVQRPDYQIVLDNDNKITQICNVATSSQCNLPKGTGKEVVQISNRQIGLGGYSAITTECGEKNMYAHNNPVERIDSSECSSRFYSISDYHIPVKLIFGVFTLGIYDLYCWDYLDVTLDASKFQEAVESAHIADLQKLLYSTNDTSSESVISVLYVDMDDIDETYKQFIKLPANNNSVVLIDQETKVPLYLIKFNNAKSETLPEVVNKQLAAMMEYLSDNPSSKIKVDIRRLIPAEVALPKLPPLPVMVKSEYETKSEFDDRVKNAVVEREDTIRNLSEMYRNNVQDRNLYVKALSAAWQQYIENKAEEQDEFLKNVGKHRAQLAKLFYELDYGRFTATDMAYDAETKSLYFVAHSAHFDFTQKIVATVSPEKARSIKDGSNYTLLPKFEYKNGKIIHSENILTELTSGDEFKLRYTDVNYKPAEVSIRVTSQTTNIAKAESVVFKEYEQKPQNLVTNDTKEIWYIETRNSINAKIPEWFSAPTQNGKAIGYGVGNTYEEASTKARSELAYMVRTRVASTINMLTSENTFRSFQEVKAQTMANTDVELSVGDYSVYKQTESEGRYYVALCYRCEGN